MRLPKDRFRYERDPRSQPIRADPPPGRYVYVQDELGEIYVVPDMEPHLHPRVLGEGRPACYAGDLTLAEGGVVTDVTNLSGTFQFRGKGGLLAIAELLRAHGLVVKEGAARWFPPEGGDLVILG